MGRRNNNRKAERAAASFGEAEVREELSGNMKAAKSFGKAEAREQMKVRDPKPRNNGGGRSYPGDITRPYVRVNPSVERVITGPSMQSVSGQRVFATYPYFSHVYPEVDAVITLFPNVDWNFFTGVSTDPAIVRLVTAVQQEYLDILQYIQDKRFISSLTSGTIGPDWITWLTLVSQAYTGLRGFQSIMESPVYNTRMNVIKNAVYTFRIRIEADLDNILNYPLPSKLYEILDHVCGVKKICCNTVKICIPGIGDSGTVLPDHTPDLEVAAEVDKSLTGIETVLAALSAGGAPFTAAANAFIITDAMRLAYPTRNLMPKGASEEGWEYDMLKYQAVAATTGHGFPISTVDQDAFALLATCCHNYDTQYATLLRTAVASSGSPTDYYGLFQGRSALGGGSLSGVFYPYDQTVAGNSLGAHLAAIVTAGGSVNYTDPALFEFPWSLLSVKATSKADEQLVGSLFNDVCQYMVNLDDLVEESIYLVKQVFSTGLR
jgi:hypothetical protein